MAIIDPDGLFFGERLANCSDLAQLYWPRLFLAANSCARLELSYKPLVSRVFGNFQKIPESSEIFQIFQEYSDNFLAVLYEAPDGGWWCQFITSEKYLTKYKKTRDMSGPAPSYELMEASRKGYLEWKKVKSINANTFGNFQKVSDGVGVGVGIGVGIGEEQKPSPAFCSGRGDFGKPATPPDPPKAPKPSPTGKQPNGPAPPFEWPIPPEPDPPASPADIPRPPTKTALAKSRHAEFKAAILRYWEFKNPGVEMPWGPGEGKNLEMWLRESPGTTIEQFTEYLRNRAKSDVNHPERPSAWIRNITSFASGPLDRFGKLIAPAVNPVRQKTRYDIQVEEQMAERREAIRKAGLQ